jgi:hypothetical protein
MRGLHPFSVPQFITLPQNLKDMAQSHLKIVYGRDDDQETKSDSVEVELSSRGKQDLLAVPQMMKSNSMGKPDRTESLEYYLQSAKSVTTAAYTPVVLRKVFLLFTNCS